jgi:23S rRNA pseudouridine1911/1915/1917 synthase
MDRWLKGRFPGLSGTQIEEALERGLIRDSAGRPLAKGDRLDPAESPDVGALERHLTSLRAGNPSLKVDIVAKEDDFLIVDKPAGMPGHPLSLFDRDTLTHWAMAQFPEIAREFAAPQPTLVPHRLDTGTSGMIVVALTRVAFERWRESFRTKEVTKRYHAWCWGEPEGSTFEINLAIAHVPGQSGKMTTPASGTRYAPPVLEAQSLIKVLRRHPRGCFLAEVTCTTGVTHQVRVHLASRGYPLLGDSLYDPAFSHRPYQGAPHLLRAVELCLRDHVGKEKVWRAVTETFDEVAGKVLRMAE